MLFDGLISLSALGYVAVALVLTHITIASVTIFLHRHQSHNALSLHPAVSHFFRFWLWLTTGMVTKEWVAIHRKHHVKCETADDPHSPKTKGLLQVLFAGAWLYHKEAANEETLAKYGQGTPADALERRLYGRHPVLGIALMAAIDTLLFGAVGLVIFAVQMIWIPLWAAGVINGIGHFWGYRNFETGDASTNIIPWGILIGGEELHNNHHAHAASARLSNKWWEFDLGWFYIRLLAFFGLAKIRRVAPKARRAEAKQTVDVETVRAIVRNRFHIMKLYGRKVIRPVVREVRLSVDSKRQRLFRRARKLMTREDIRLEGATIDTLNKALQQSQVLKTVYEFKQQLKEIWLKTSHNQAGRAKRLQAWCVAAEQTGIHALQEFALYLRGYTLQESRGV
jgi:stearoyl-CoA desaturase (delta-9 desaturase)